MRLTLLGLLLASPLVAQDSTKVDSTAQTIYSRTTRLYFTKTLPAVRDTLYCTAGVCSKTKPVPPDTTVTPPPTSCTRTVPAASVSAINAAWSNAQPGDCITIPAGSYSLGAPRWAATGTATKPITLQGVGSATVFTLGGNGGIYLKGAYVRIRKVRVTSGFFGIQTEGCGWCELDSLEVDNVSQAAINLRYGTHHSVVKNSKIHDTGKATKRYGEGVYIGGYSTPANTSADNLADDNQVLNNRFGPNVTAESIDLSDGADRLTAIGNIIDGTGTVSEYGAMNSLIGVRGTGHVISDNVLSKGAPYGIDQYNGSATYRRNTITGATVGINIAGGTATVHCDNQASSNKTCVP